MRKVLNIYFFTFEARPYTTQTLMYLTSNLDPKSNFRKTDFLK